jgi:predicted nucleic acid-binding protein
VTRPRLLAFIDCNILIAGMFVPMHPARAVMVLASNKHLDLITCREVIEDIEDEILERAKIRNDYELVDTCAKLIKATRIKVLPNPSVDHVKTTFKKYLGVMHHQADIPVLASALEVEPNMILSDNREHFNDRVAERCGIRIYSAEEFLNSLITGAIREQLGLEK